MSYIKKILEYYFYHKVDNKYKIRIYKRLLYPEKDDERDKSLQDIWNNIERDASDSWEQPYEKLSSKIFNKPASRKNIVWSSFIRIAAIWAIPFVMLCGAAYLYYSAKGIENIQTQDFAYIQKYVEYGEKENIVLPDSSIVWLNSGSILIYPKDFSNHNRMVYLVGEGYFDVAKDSSRPFIVNTSYLKLQVLGTRFNVSAYAGEINVKTTLESGALKVVSNSDSLTSYYLRPNEQLEYNTSTNSFLKREVDASDYSDWRSGGLFFDNIKFSDAIKTLERIYNIKIHLRTSVYNNQSLYVHFNEEEPLEKVFFLIKMMIPELEYKIEGTSVYIE